MVSYQAYPNLLGKKGYVVVVVVVVVSYQGNLGYGKNYSLQSGLVISLGIYSVALHSFIRSLFFSNTQESCVSLY